MATFAAAKEPPTFVRQLRMLPQPKGDEEQPLNRKAFEISQSIQGVEFFKRLNQPLENEKRQQELESYLDSLRSEAQSANEAEFTVAVIDYSWQVWQALSNHFSQRGLCLEVPDACPGQSDNFMYTWSKAEHYLECEIFGSEAVEFFYRNRKSGEVWGEDTTLEHGFSTAIFEKAVLFTW